MKQILILLAVLVGSFGAVQAQTNFNCMYTQYCSWDDGMQQYTNCIGGLENSSFEINKAETSITQIIKNVKTSYPVQSKERKKKGVTIYLVKNDAGDKYYYIVNSRIKEVRILDKKQGKATLTIYSQNDAEIAK